MQISHFDVGQVYMAFVVGFPGTRRRHDSIWVIIDMLTKLAYFLTIKIFFGGKQFYVIYLGNTEVGWSLFHHMEWGT